MSMPNDCSVEVLSGFSQVLHCYRDPSYTPKKQLSIGVHQKNTVSSLADVLFQKHFFFGLTSLLATPWITRLTRHPGLTGSPLCQILEDHVPSFVLSLFEDRLKVQLPRLATRQDDTVVEQIPFDPQVLPSCYHLCLYFLGRWNPDGSFWVFFLLCFIRMGTFKSHY